MNDDEVRSILAAVECRWPIGWTVGLGAGRMAIDGRRVVEVHTPPTQCSRTGETTSGGGCGIPIDGRDEAEIVGAAREAIRMHVLHEVDEWFLFRGEREFDPHKEVPGDR